VLARWLGPWASGAPRVAIREVAMAGEQAMIRTRHYGDAGNAPLIIAPGLHLAGPDDPRLDRLCRVLAASGHEVIAPFLPDHVRLVPGARACQDFVRVIDACARPATIFSISLGSRLAVHAAAVRPDAVARLVVFGGYGELAPTLTYGLTGIVDGVRRARRDPITHAITAINVLGPPPEVIDALRAFVARARPDTCEAIANDVRASLPPPLRSIFDDGVGLGDGASARVVAAIATATQLTAELDSAADAARVRCPVDIIHGKDDGDVPVEQAHALARLLTAAPRVGVHILDDYHHTGFSPGALRGLLVQARTLLRVLRALAPR